MDFVHLHVHSHYSLLYGMMKPKKFPAYAKERGFSAISLVDYGSMYGAIEFYQACIENGIKPIIGFEAYISPRRMEDKDPELDKELYHLVLLAENYDGYRNLMLLTSEGHLRGTFNGKPRIDKETLKKYSKNIIVLSAGLKGEVSKFLRLNKLEEAKKAALEYNEIFGQNNFFLELQDHPAMEGQIDVNAKLIALSKETGIPLVVTRDVFYASPDYAEAQDIMCCIREGWKVQYTDRENFRHVDRSLNTGDDIFSRFRHVPEALENTVKIAERIDIKIELNKWHFAPVPLEAGKTYDEMLRDQTYDRVLLYYPEITEELKTRIEYELDIIKTKGYSPYFLCVADFVNYAKSKGIVETTRGSAAGSLVSYIMGITTVDPMRFHLPFERFLNPFRPSAPDVDTDFADDRREEMIKYVTDKYGADKVAQIITFGTMAARASVRDVGRALGFSYSFCDQVSKLIPPGAQGFPMTIARALKEEPDLKKLYESNEDVQKLLTLAQKVEGCARHTSIHAAGVVIAPTALTDFTPVQYEVGGTRLTTQYEMKAVETAGVLKNDFLGIRNLSILGKAVEIVHATTGESVDIYKLPLDDTKTFEMLARGETMGTFQLGGSGMTRWLKELKPTNIDDIMAMVALYRPGPMESIPEYIKRKYDPSAVKFFDPRLEKILSASYGLLVYQDDVMLTAIALAGYDWMEADKFRKAMGKKIPEEMAQQKEKFYKGCLEIGKVKKEIVDEMWNAIAPFASYGFNKAHAASYGIVAYQTSYMKAHYPVQYMTAVLQAEAGDAEKVAAIVHECTRIKIEVLPPDVNESFRNFAMVSKSGEAGRIRFGLSAIKNVGEHICEMIYNERKKNGPYKNLEDFLKRIQDKDLNKRSIESLAQAGALDCFGIDRGILLGNTEQLLAFSHHEREKNETQQDSLFAGALFDFESKVVLKSATNATLDDKLKWEKQLLGIYLSSHPCANYEEKLRGVITPLCDVENYARDAWVVVCAVVASIKKKITKKGDIMLFVAVEDRSGGMELLVFPKTYATTQSLWVEGAVLCIVGKTPKEEGENKIFVENAHVLTPENAETIGRQVRIGQNSGSKSKSSSGSGEREKAMRITIDPNVLKEKMESLKEVFGKFPGEYRVYLSVAGNSIKTGSSVAWGEEIKNTLEGILGVVPMDVFE
jgi:DNA polymerase-3 subunit alpha